MECFENEQQENPKGLKFETERTLKMQTKINMGATGQERCHEESIKNMGEN